MACQCNLLHAVKLCYISIVRVISDTSWCASLSTILSTNIWPSNEWGSMIAFRSTPWARGFCSDTSHARGVHPMPGICKGGRIDKSRMPRGPSCSRTRLGLTYPRKRLLQMVFCRVWHKAFEVEIDKLVGSMFSISNFSPQEPKRANFSNLAFIRCRFPCE